MGRPCKVPLVLCRMLTSMTWKEICGRDLPRAAINDELTARYAVGCLKKWHCSVLGPPRRHLSTAEEV